jgi:hypothetical protein
MDVDLVAVQASKTLLDVAVTAIGIMTPSDGDAAIATVISTTTVVGDTIGEA